MHAAEQCRPSRWLDGRGLSPIASARSSSSMARRRRGLTGPATSAARRVRPPQRSFLVLHGSAVAQTHWLRGSTGAASAALVPRPPWLGGGTDSLAPRPPRLDGCDLHGWTGAASAVLTPRPPWLGGVALDLGENPSRGATRQHRPWLLADWGK